MNHYDIKCDNYLLEAGVDFLSGRPVSDEEFFNPQGALPFRVCLADFGEAKIFNPKDELSGYTIRNRGTEFNKSPEMLNYAYVPFVKKGFMCATHAFAQLCFKEGQGHVR